MIIKFPTKKWNRQGVILFHEAIPLKEGANLYLSNNSKFDLNVSKLMFLCSKNFQRIRMFTLCFLTKSSDRTYRDFLYVGICLRLFSFRLIFFHIFP
jgi:hypothetical protein